MSTTSTTSPVNTYQLALAVGAPLVVRGPWPDGHTEVTATGVSQSALDAAVAGHVADPAVRPPTGPTPPNPHAWQTIAEDGSCWWSWYDDAGVLQTDPCQEP